MAELGIWTHAVYSGLGMDTSHKTVIPPIHLSTNYVFATPGESGGYDYSRTGSPTRDLLSDALATLERGTATTVVATGLTVVTLLVEELVPVGDVVVCQHDCYGGTWRLLNRHATRGRLKAHFVDFNNPEVFKASLDGTSMVLAEIPSNPLLRITDLRTVAETTYAAGAQLVTDNTFCLPLLQHPINLGADCVLHSTTGFIDGHSDVIGGAVVTHNSETAEHVGRLTSVFGLTAGAFDPCLTLRRLRTLGARIQIHAINTEAVVDAAQGHLAITALHQPGLETHPGHELAARQQSDFGSLPNVNLADDRPAAKHFLQGLQVFHPAESLGGMESLICHPATTTHAGMSPEARAAAEVSNGLLRLSVSLEAAEDLTAAIAETLDRIQGRGESTG